MADANYKFLRNLEAEKRRRADSEVMTSRLRTNREIYDKSYDRDFLYKGEDEYFKKNPHVGGMAAEDDRVIINPYSSLSPEEKQAVAQNEYLRIKMRQKKIVPNIELTEEQMKAFKGTEYEKDQNALKQTITTRILTGDPSAKATKEQIAEAKRILEQLK